MEKMMSSFGRKYYEKKIQKVMARSGAAMQLDEKEVSKFGFDELVEWGFKNRYVVEHVWVTPPKSPNKMHSTTIIARSYEDVIGILKAAITDLSNAYAANQKNKTPPQLLAVHKDILRQYALHYQELAKRLAAGELKNPEPVEDKFAYLDKEMPQIRLDVEESERDKYFKDHNIPKLSPEMDTRIASWVDGLDIENDNEITLGEFLDKFKSEFGDDIDPLHYEAIEQMFRTNFGDSKDLIPYDVKISDLSTYVNKTRTESLVSGS
jgi:hypothetical protein